MFPSSTAHLLLCVIASLSVLLMLLRPHGIAEVWWVGSGAVLLVVLRLIPLRLAGKAVAEGADVYLFLLGMMLLSELARSSGIFDWVANKALLGSQQQCRRLFLLIYSVGTVVTVCMSNDATAVVLTPAVLSAVKKAKVPPQPYLFACAMIANAASFVLPISNPANLVVFHTGMPPLSHWLASFLLPSALSIAVTYLALGSYFRAELTPSIQCEVEDGPLSPNGKLVLWGLVLVVAVLLTASAFNVDLGLPTCLAALLITAVVSIKERCNPLDYAREVSWSTLLLVASLFVMVDAVESLGALHFTQAALTWVKHLPVAAGTLLLGFVVALGNNVVNNLPLGLIAGATVHASHIKGVLADTVLLAVDLGPNLSVTGSLATILWLLAMRKEGVNVSAWEFLKVGLLTMPAALFASLAGVLLVHRLARL